MNGDVLAPRRRIPVALGRSGGRAARRRRDERRRESVRACRWPRCANGRLGLVRRTESGRLTLPRGVAVDGDTVLVLSSDGYAHLSLRRRARHARAAAGDRRRRACGPSPPDAAFQRAAPLPRRVEHRGASTARSTSPIRESHRVQVFDLATLALLRIHDGLDDPADVAAGAGAASRPRSGGRPRLSRVARERRAHGGRSTSRRSAAAGVASRSIARARLSARSQREPRPLRRLRPHRGRPARPSRAGHQQRRSPRSLRGSRRFTSMDAAVSCSPTPARSRAGCAGRPTAS